MNGFPAHLFRIGGSPEAIESSAARYRKFGQAASNGADQITSMDTSQFIGPEGDLFRDKVNSSLPPNLRTTGEAFTQVATALSRFSGELGGLQSQMRPIAHEAPTLWEQLQAAKGRLSDAKDADARHTAAQQDAEQQHAATVASAQAANQPPPPDLPPSTYHSDSGAAHGALAAAQQAWDECVRRATTLRNEMTAAADACGRQIDIAKGMRFAEPPSDWNLLDKAKDFITEHKDILQSISGALKVVSGVLAGIGLILQAIPVVGNAVGAVFLAAAGITGGAALGIDIAVYAATGEGSLTSIAIDTALTVIPIGRVVGATGKLLSRVGAPGLKLAGKGRRAAGFGSDVRAPAKGEQSVQFVNDAHQRRNMDFTDLQVTSKANSEPALHSGSTRDGRLYMGRTGELMSKKYEGIQGINFGEAMKGTPGHTVNCTNSVTALRDTVATGKINDLFGATKAAPMTEAEAMSRGIPWLEKEFGTGAVSHANYDSIIRYMGDQPLGAEAVVARTSSGDHFGSGIGGHVFSVIKTDAGVAFIDPQAGTLAALREFSELHLLHYK